MIERTQFLCDNYDAIVCFFARVTLSPAFEWVCAAVIIGSVSYLTYLAWLGFTPEGNAVAYRKLYAYHSEAYWQRFGVVNSILLVLVGVVTVAFCVMILVVPYLLIASGWL